MKVSNSTKKEQKQMELKELIQLLKRLKLMNNRDSMRYLKDNYPEVYSGLEDVLVELVCQQADLIYE